MKWHELEIEQKKGLNQKIALAQKVIAQAFDRASKPALAFSGGKDSTVLLDLVRRFFPEHLQRLVVIYGNTGVEFPECVKFARWLAKEWRLDFHEARPGKTDRPGFKYAGQHRIWQRLIADGTIDRVLKEDGKLKSTLALERACPPDLRAELERERLVWKAGTTMSYPGPTRYGPSGADSATGSISRPRPRPPGKRRQSTPSGSEWQSAGRKRPGRRNWWRPGGCGGMRWPSWPCR